MQLIALQTFENLNINIKFKYKKYKCWNMLDKIAKSEI